jgi:hypothetical protein
MTFDEFRADIAAFADDENDVLVERGGQVLFRRNGNDIAARLCEDVSGSFTVDIDGVIFPYRRFIADYLAGMPMFAERLFNRRTGVDAFVDGPAKLESVYNGTKQATALTLLDEECRTQSPFASRLIFVTADAGFGKTALLREYQMNCALKYLDQQSSFLFWHVDLQGRQLLRLSEALLGDLGDLRISGIYMSGIVRLLRHRLLVIGIDGFDELAAEQGSTDALGALALIVKQMKDQGTLVASSRRTFFDTEDYLKRTKLLKRTVESECEFDQIHLQPWKKGEAVTFLHKYRLEGKGFADPEVTYKQIECALGGEEHPMIGRPFLLSYIAKGLLRYGLEPATFLEKHSGPITGVDEVVQAFISREVAQKWISRDTGEPYLTVDQHLELLSQVAEEMWESQVDRLSLEVIEAITATLFDDWGFSAERRQQSFNMVKMHVMLVPPPDSDGRFRSFDHPEFRNYFIAYSIAALFKCGMSTPSKSRLGRLLSAAQIPDSVAQYTWLLVQSAEDNLKSDVAMLVSLIEDEWRPTFLPTNVGTLLPQLLDGRTPAEKIVIDKRLIYSGLMFEGVRLTNVQFVNGVFSKTSFADVEWSGVTFSDCELTDITLYRTSTYRDVVFHNCNFHGVSLIDGEEETREYAPQRVAALLASLGITVTAADIATVAPNNTLPEKDFHKLARRVLRVFRRTTSLTNSIVQIKFKSDAAAIREQLLPLMERCGVVQGTVYHGSGSAQEGWKLEVILEDLLASDGSGENDHLAMFWQEVAKIDG